MNDDLGRRQDNAQETFMAWYQCVWELRGRFPFRAGARLGRCEGASDNGRPQDKSESPSGSRPSLQTTYSTTTPERNSICSRLSRPRSRWLMNLLTSGISTSGPKTIKSTFPIRQEKGDNAVMELGNAYIGWLFGGVYPNLMYQDRRNATQSLCLLGVCWHQTWHRGMTAPCLETRYSMNIARIERVMDGASWTGLDAERDPCRARMTLLHPPQPFQNRRTARCTRPANDLRWTETLENRDFLNGLVNGLEALAWTPFRYRDINWDDRGYRLSGDSNNTGTTTGSKGLRDAGLPSGLQKVYERLTHEEQQRYGHRLVEAMQHLIDARQQEDQGSDTY